MLEDLKHIENLVFVGGFAMHKLGIKENYSDIDIVVTDKDFLKGITWYETDSAFSGTGIRGFLLYGDIKLDVFLEWTWNRSNSLYCFTYTWASEI